jgi:hypothetical protein
MHGIFEKLRIIRDENLVVCALTLWRALQQIVVSLSLFLANENYLGDDE